MWSQVLPFLKKQFFLLLFLTGCWQFLSAAHYSKGALHLDILLKTTSQITIYADDKIKVEQQNLPVSYTLQAPLKVSLVNAEIDGYYSFLLNTVSQEELQGMPDEEENVSEVQKNTWEHGKLQIRKWYKFYDKRSFNSFEAAAEVARREKIPVKSIEKLTYPNTQVQIRDLKGSLYYMELPINLSTKNGMHIDGEPDVYAGSLVLQPAGKVMRLINNIELEEYLMGVVPNEIGDSAPLEALKAQTVAARSETICNLLYNRHIDDHADLCNTTHCQVYKGNFKHQPRIEEAVLDTAGEVLLADSMIVDAVYGSSCGGKSEENQYVWKGKAHSYLKSVTCMAGADTFDLQNEDDARAWIDIPPPAQNGASWETKSIAWEKSISRSQLQKNSGVDDIQNIHILKRGLSGRIINLEIVGKSRTLTLDNEYKIRQVFGGLPSSFFYISGSDTYRIKGKGSGHGVGLCQVGTLRQARAGELYEPILHYYFANCTIYRDWMP
jgi:SpoIID/LytB domain protein